jgi:pantoate ligase / CMP/dCMP kinase
LGGTVRLFHSAAGLRCFLDLQRAKRDRASVDVSSPAYSGIASAPEVGFVPTMGALHVGHLSLIQRARQENEIVVVSIFVNPLQFGPQEDFRRYPRTLNEDCELCEQVGVDAVFAPTAEEVGIRSSAREQGGTGAGEQAGQGETGLPDVLTTTATSSLIPHPSSLTQVLPPTAMTSVLCGQFRPGHFQGVATIVTKLLNLVQPDRAYFGQKDAQQLAIIRQLVADLNLPVEIIGCSIVRERSGLAYSSRNQYLTTEEREQSAILYRGLQKAKSLFNVGERVSSVLIETVKAEIDTVPAMQPEYIELVDSSTLTPVKRVEESGLLAVAARIGSTRLIDNVRLCDRKPIVAIDGPAGAGKSTIARHLAQALGVTYLDTGAMYRALTWLVLNSGISVNDEPAVAELVSQCEIEFREAEVHQKDEGKLLNSSSSTAEVPLSATKLPPSIWVNGKDVTQEIRSLEVTAQVSAIAAQPAVRQELVKQQQRYGRRGGIVIEGRDIGTHVFPDAEVKIFLTASVQERARRRQKDLKEQGKGEISLDQLEHAIIERDQKDSTRALAPLRKAADAIEIQTDDFTIHQVIEKIVQIYRDKLAEEN